MVLGLGLEVDHRALAGIDLDDALLPVAALQVIHVDYSLAHAVLDGGGFAMFDFTTIGLAVADASLRYGRLWRQGIPYSTLMMNNINHPNVFGMSLFADALMALFP